MKKKIRIILDITLTILLPLLMIKMLTGQELHEWLGIAMVLVFVAHHIVNIGWLKNLFKGKYSSVRALSTLIDILMIADMLSLAYSGIAMSGFVLSNIDFNANMIFVRKLHLFASFWGLILMSFHMGMHLAIMLKLMIGKNNGRLNSKLIKVIGYVVSMILVIVGVYGFITLKIADYIFLRTVFMSFDSTVPQWLYIVQFLGVLGLFAVLGYYINAFLGRVKISNTILKYMTFVIAIIIMIVSYMLVSGNLSEGIHLLNGFFSITFS